MAARGRDRVLPDIRTWAEGGAALSGVEAVRGHDATLAVRSRCGRAFERVDALLSPTIPVVSYPAGWASPLDAPARPFEHIAFTVPWNTGEQPAVSLPCGVAGSGLPIGLQSIGPRFAGLAVLRLVPSFGSARRSAMPWPQP